MEGSSLFPLASAAWLSAALGCSALGCSAKKEPAETDRAPAPALSAEQRKQDPGMQGPGGEPQGEVPPPVAVEVWLDGDKLATPVMTFGRGAEERALGDLLEEAKIPCPDSHSIEFVGEHASVRVLCTELRTASKALLKHNRASEPQFVYVGPDGHKRGRGVQSIRIAETEEH